MMKKSYIGITSAILWLATIATASAATYEEFTNIVLGIAYVALVAIFALAILIAIWKSKVL